MYRTNVYCNTSSYRRKVEHLQFFFLQNKPAATVCGSDTNKTRRSFGKVIYLYSRSSNCIALLSFYILLPSSDLIGITNSFESVIIEIFSIVSFFVLFFVVWFFYFSKKFRAKKKNPPKSIETIKKCV